MKNSLLNFSVVSRATQLALYATDLKLCNINGADYVSVTTLAEAIGIPNNNVYSVVVANLAKFQVAKVMLRSEGLNGQVAGVAISRKTVVIPILRVPELMQYIKSMKLNAEQRAVVETLSVDLPSVFIAKLGRAPVAATTYASPEEVTQATATHRKVSYQKLTPQPVQVTAVLPTLKEIPVEKVDKATPGTTRRDIIHSIIKAMVGGVPDSRKASTAMKLAKCVPPLDGLSEDNFLDVVVDLALVNQ